MKETLHAKGLRVIGRRKMKYITILDVVLANLSAYGVNSALLVKMYKLDHPYAIQTKRFTGIIGELKQMLEIERMADKRRIVGKEAA
jgi:hypothetical protein